MALRGDLASVDLAQVFQMLALNKKVGLLSIHSPSLWQVLYFDQRGVTPYHNVDQVLDRALLALVRAGLLDEQQLAQLRERAAASDEQLADLLLTEGYVDAQELDRRYCAELEEELYGLFFCSDAKFEFHEGATTLEGREGAIVERCFFNCDSVIMEAARRVDEWTYISGLIPALSEVYVPVLGDADLSPFGEDAPPIMALLDGLHTVSRLVEATGLAEFVVCKTLSQMLDAGLIAPMDPAELLPGAGFCLENDRSAHAADLCLRALETGQDAVHAHQLAARAYRDLQEYELSGHHAECAAEALIAQGDLVAGATALRDLAAQLPTNLRARERLITVALSLPTEALPDFAMLAEGKLLAESLMDCGETARVSQLLEMLLTVAADDLDLKKLLVNVYAKVGDHERVMDLNEAIADDLVRLGRPLEAVACLQKVLLLDRRRLDIAERMRRLYEADERGRKRRRTMHTLSGLFALTCLLAAGYSYYDHQAGRAFAELSVADMVREQDYVGAAHAYELFNATHPLSTSVAVANRELHKLGQLQAQREGELEAAKLLREAEQRTLRQKYRELFLAHREQFLAAQPEASLQTLAQVRALVAQCGASEDLTWAMEMQVERTWRQLEEHLAAATALAAQYDIAWQAGEWQRAREFAVQLRSKFETTQAAARCALPLRVTTRPAGAWLEVVGGDPADAAAAAQRTPAIVRCASTNITLRATSPGFEATTAQVQPLADGEFELRLQAIPTRSVAFDAVPHTRAALQGEWLAVGLRGGGLGVARTDGKAQNIKRLPGLRSLDGAPALSDDSVFFLTTDNTLEALRLADLTPVPGFPVRLLNAAASELVARDGRLLVLDRSAVLLCYEQASGRLLWSSTLGSAAAGAPTLERRAVRVALVDGRVLTLDAATGVLQQTYVAESTPATRVAATRPGQFVFATTNGQVIGLAATGEVLWTQQISGRPSDAQFAANEQGVLVVDGQGDVVVLEAQTGEMRRKLSRDGGEVVAVQLQAGRACLTIRRQAGKAQPQTDTLVVTDLASGEVLWQYADMDVALGAPGVAADGLAWSSCRRGVLWFR